MELPEIPWQEKVELSAMKSAVLVVDMQNDFVHEKGALRVPAAAATVEPIRALLERARRAEAHVIYTQDWHELDDPEFRIWPKHCVAGTWGAEIVAELAPKPGEPRVKKTTYDPFYLTELEDLLREHGVKELVIVGTVANICVLHAAGSAALRGFRVVVPKDGVSALSEFDFLLAFRQITFLYRGVAVSGQAGILFS
ncbi:cysteine hydrolase [Candidatus Bipolaricaulota bacterium]|nr:cysteine hydrolase [Candidatus Bipolaricaulota bacterium]